MHSWPPELIMVQPYSMWPLIRYNARTVTMPNGTVVIEQAMGTLRRVDVWQADILQCLLAPRSLQLAARREYGDDTIVMHVQIPGIEKIVEGTPEGRRRRVHAHTGRQRGQDRPAVADDLQRP